MRSATSNAPQNSMALPSTFISDGWRSTPVSADPKLSIIATTNYVNICAPEAENPPPKQSSFTAESSTPHEGADHLNFPPCDLTRDDEVILYIPRARVRTMESRIM